MFFSLHVLHPSDVLEPALPSLLLHTEQQKGSTGLPESAQRQQVAAGCRLRSVQPASASPPAKLCSGHIIGSCTSLREGHRAHAFRAILTIKRNVFFSWICHISKLKYFFITVFNIYPVSCWNLSFVFSYLLAKETDRRIKLPCHALQSGPTETSCPQTAPTDQVGMNTGLRQWGWLFSENFALGLWPSQCVFFGSLHAYLKLPH